MFNVWHRPLVAVVVITAIKEDVRGSSMMSVNPNHSHYMFIM